MADRGTADESNGRCGWVDDEYPVGAVRSPLGDVTKLFQRQMGRVQTPSVRSGRGPTAHGAPIESLVVDLRHHHHLGIRRLHARHADRKHHSVRRDAGRDSAHRRRHRSVCTWIVDKVGAEGTGSDEISREQIERSDGRLANMEIMLKDSNPRRIPAIM